MADSPAATSATSATSVAVVERDTIPTDDYRHALLALLTAHAVPVWGWGQRDLWSTMVMDGPGLANWVLTANLWAEQERRLWEWEQLVRGAGAEPESLIVDGLEPVDRWIDLVMLAACVDGIGEAMVRTFAESTYAPLRRQAKLLMMYKRAQSADGCAAVRNAMRDSSVDMAVIDVAATRWVEIAHRCAEAVAEIQSQARWVDHGIATPFDPLAAVARVEQRLRAHLRPETPFVPNASRAPGQSR